MRYISPVEQQWLFEKSSLDHTPSRQAGIALEDELNRRKLTISHIIELAMKSGLSVGIPKSRNAAGVSDLETISGRGVITIACNLVHRFYMRRSLIDFKEKLIAATILFLASKVEEEPLKLRYIVNSCLSLWEPRAVQWEPESHSKSRIPDQSPEYHRWEQEILATEELVLEALCFDTGVKQPWTILRRSIKGLDYGYINGDSVQGETSQMAQIKGELDGHVNGKGKQKAKLADSIVRELGFVVLNEINYTPLVILHHSNVLALATLGLVVTLCHRIPFDEGVAAAAELGKQFDVDVEFDPDKGVVGPDAQSLIDCRNGVVEYCKMKLIDEGLSTWLTMPGRYPLSRRFTPEPADTTVPEPEIDPIIDEPPPVPEVKVITP